MDVLVCFSNQFPKLKSVVDGCEEGIVNDPECSVPVLDNVSNNRRIKAMDKVWHCSCRSYSVAFLLV